LCADESHALRVARLGYATQVTVVTNTREQEAGSRKQEAGSREAGSRKIPSACLLPPASCPL
jgi:hypothetical protein